MPVCLCREAAWISSMSGMAESEKLRSAGILPPSAIQRAASLSRSLSVLSTSSFILRIWRLAERWKSAQLAFRLAPWVEMSGLDRSCMMERARPKKPAISNFGATATGASGAVSGFGTPGAGAVGSGVTGSGIVSGTGGSEVVSSGAIGVSTGLEGVGTTTTPGGGVTGSAGSGLERKRNAPMPTTAATSRPIIGTPDDFFRLTGT